MGELNPKEKRQELQRRREELGLKVIPGGQPDEQPKKAPEAQDAGPILEFKRASEAPKPRNDEPGVRSETFGPGKQD